MTTESYKNGATTLSRMNFCGYVGHVTVVGCTFTTARVFSSRVRVRVRVRIRFSVRLVSSYAHVFILFFVVKEHRTLTPFLWFYTIG